MDQPKLPPPESPLEVLLRLMRMRWTEKLYDASANLAKAAAPYVHPRATPVRTTGEMDDEDLNTWTNVPHDPADDA